MTLCVTSDLIPSLQGLAALEASKNPMRDSEVELPKEATEWIEIFQKFMPIFENIEDLKYQEIIDEKISSLKKKVDKKGSSSVYIEKSTQKILLEVIKIASIIHYDLFDDAENSALFEIFSKDELLKDSVEEFKSVAKRIHLREKTNIVSASEENNSDLVDHFINIKVNINRKIYGNTALMGAAFYDHGEIVQKLIEAKANLDLQNKNGNTALMFAAFYDHGEIVQKLIEAKAKLDLQNKNGNTALMFAAYKGYVEFVQKLIDARANLNLQDEDGDTALILAIHKSHKENVLKLIEAGANLDLQNKKEETALMLAVKYDYKEIEKKLRYAIEQSEKSKKRKRI